MGTLLKWPAVRLELSRSSTKPRLSWSKLLKQIQAAKQEAENILRESEREAREGCRFIGSCDPQVVENKYTYRSFNIVVTGTCNYLISLRNTNEFFITPDIVNRTDNQTDYEPKGTADRVTAMPSKLRAKAPLRVILRKYPELDSKGRETFITREELECGHWHTFHGLVRENRSKRRRCRDCQQGRPVPQKPLQILQWESSTAGQYSWSIQRKSTITI